MPRELSIRTVQTEIKTPEGKPSIPNPQHLNLLDVDFVVLTPDTIPRNEDWVYIALTPRQYENLAKNQAEFLRFTKESLWRLKYYRGENSD